MEMPLLKAIDLFCGAGGSSWGARLAGAEIVAGFDSSDVAAEVYSRNFPDAWLYEGSLEDWNPKRVAKDLGRIDLLLASPECTNHSPAKGNSPRCETSKNTAFQVTRFARAFEPRWIIVENVVSMKGWSRYDEFIEELEDLGYNVSAQVLNAMHFGVPQSRRRLFVLCDRQREPSTVTRSSRKPVPAAQIIEQNGTFPYSPLRTARRAKPTLQRADRAIEALGDRRSFLLVYYGSDKVGGWQRLNRPLRTITTLDRFAFVKRRNNQHVMRMLQVPELKAAMGMPKCFFTRTNSRRNSIKLLGNAVCPPVMRAVVRSLCKG